MGQMPWTFKPKWGGPCLCGSGRKYRDCCHKRLPGSRIGTAFREAVKQQDWPRALLACRADITQYTIWHKTNVDPLLRAGQNDLGLLAVDVGALGDLVDRLLWLHTRTKRLGEWPAVTERLRGNIDHPLWQRKIGYQRAMMYVGPLDDREKARRELKKIGAIEPSDDDVELLQVFVDLCLEELPFAKRLEYLDGILVKSNQRHDQVQYRSAKAVQYALIGDTVTSEQLLKEAVELARSIPADEPIYSYSRHVGAKAIQLYGSLRNDKAILQEAYDLFASMLQREEDFTLQGRSSLNSELGDCCKYMDNWKGAVSHYRTALEIMDRPVLRVHLAEALLHDGRSQEAVTEIDAVDSAALKHDEMTDYVLAFAAVAIWLEDAGRLKVAKQRLSELITSVPYFNERRLTLMVRVSETLDRGRATEEAKADATPSGGFLQVLNKALILQPNIMGIGLNMNAVIDHFSEGKDRSRK